MPAIDPVYYNECHRVFRQATDQGDRMLEDMRAILSSRREPTILSVGSGMGLFEVPMLEALLEDGTGVGSFVGLDLNPQACEILMDRLRERFGDQVTWQVAASSFDMFQPQEQFSVILFNHSLEYLGGALTEHLERVEGLLTDDGICLIYSPDKGGINGPYESLAVAGSRITPAFTQDLVRALRELDLTFSHRRIAASCSLRILEQDRTSANAVRLLSFLAQVDCRIMSPEERDELSAYYLGLRADREEHIPHPTTRILVEAVRNRPYRTAGGGQP